MGDVEHEAGQRRVAVPVEGVDLTPVLDAEHVGIALVAVGVFTVVASLTVPVAGNPADGLGAVPLVFGVLRVRHVPPVTAFAFTLAEFLAASGHNNPPSGGERTAGRAEGKYFLFGFTWSEALKTTGQTHGHGVGC